jgi:hypothetical protein
MDRSANDAMCGVMHLQWLLYFVKVVNGMAGTALEWIIYQAMSHG